MVYTGHNESVRTKIDNFTRDVKEITDKLNTKVNAGNQDNINFLKNELSKMNEKSMLRNDFIPIYPTIIDDLLDDENLKNELIKIYFEFKLCQSIVKKDFIRDSLSDKQLNFLNHSDRVLDLLINEILQHSNPNQKGLQMLQNIKNQIDRMRSALSKSAYKPSYGRIVVDNWLFDETLREELSLLEYEYMKL